MLILHWNLCCNHKLKCNILWTQFRLQVLTSQSDSRWSRLQLCPMNIKFSSLVDKFLHSECSRSLLPTHLVINGTFPSPIKKIVGTIESHLTQSSNYLRMDKRRYWCRRLHLSTAQASYRFWRDWCFGQMWFITFAHIKNRFPRLNIVSNLRRS